MSIRRKIGLAALCAAFSLTLAACGGTSSKVNAPGSGSGDNGGGDGQVGPTGRVFHITPGDSATGEMVAAMVQGAPGDTIQFARSEERRVGNECGSTCRFRWAPA